MELRRKQQKIAIMGAALDTNNMGVSALATSLVKLMLECCPDAKLALYIGNRLPQPQKVRLPGKEIEIAVHNYRLSPRARLREHLFWIFMLACFQRIMPHQGIRNRIIQGNPWLRALSEVDFVGEIRGGDSFSDIYGLRRFMTATMPVAIALLLGKKTVFLPQTYGPYSSWISRRVARRILQSASCILSRDREGLEVVGSLASKASVGQKLKFCPDVAFVLDAIKPEKLTIEPELDLYQKPFLVGVNINGLMYNGGYTRDNMFGLRLDYRSFVLKLTRHLLRETDAHLLLVPHTYGEPGNVNSDPDACRDVLKQLDDSSRQRVHVVMEQYDQSEVKWIVGLCDFFIGSRMHACIAALSQGITTVGVAYSRKFDGVFAAVGMEKMVVDGREMDTDGAINRVMQELRSRDRTCASLKERVSEAQAQIRGTFRELLVGER